MKTSHLLHFSTLALAILLAGVFHPAGAQDKPPENKAAPAQHQPAGKGILRLLLADSTTEHSVDTAQGKLAYRATAGTLPFFNESGEQTAGVFYTAYIAKDAGATRPLTFVFNGGPGAASAFLNLGLVGPRLLDLGPDGRNFAHAELRDNPDTWLRFTDLVLIDPIGTGWSRTVDPAAGKNFWNVDSDASSMAKAIALYIDKNNRAASPKYLLGESYGGFRAAKTARRLRGEQGITVNGIVMLSPLLQGWLTFGDDGSALRAALDLPSLAAAELERKGTFSAQSMAAADKFAMTDYLTTLAGPTLQGAAAEAFYQRVAQVSGLPLDVVKQRRGFVTGTFTKTLRSDRLVSEYDATFAVDDPFPEQRSAHRPDPILDGVARAYGGAFANYARNELGFNTDVTYKLLAGDVTQHWSWGNSGRMGVGVESDLRVLLSFDRTFRVLIAQGYSDMVTPFAETRYVLDHLPPLGPPGRIALKLYRGGHMVYLNPQSRKAFTSDAAAFYRGE